MTLLILIVLATSLGASVPDSPPAQVFRGTPLSLPGSDPAGLRGDGGSIPRAVQGGVPGEETPTANGMRTAPDGAAAGRDAPAATPLRGKATWCAETTTHCHGWDTRHVGAVPSFTHGDKPYRVGVCLADGSRCTNVLVVSYCACGDRNGVPTVIDLSPPAFRDLAPLSRGVITVTIELEGSVPTLPPTDMETP